jgi:hypothetical protein
MEVMTKAATRDATQPFNTLSVHQKAFLKDFVDLSRSRMIAATGRGCSKTILSALGQAILAWCLPTFTCTVNAGALKQAQENYHYLRAFAEAPGMRYPIGPIIEEPMATVVRLRNGGWIQILAASERQAKGPHPMMVVFDEACAADPEIILLVEGQLSGAPAPHGGTSALYRLQSTPDKLFHLFRTRWDDRERLGYVWHQWGARDCPWITAASIAQSRLEHDSNWCRIYIDGQFGSASGTVFRYEDIQAATITRLQDDPLWARVEQDMDAFLEERSLGVDWGFEHPTVIVVIARVRKTPELVRDFPDVSWPIAYVVQVEGHQHVEWEHLYERIAASAAAWRATVQLDAGGNPAGEATVRRILGPLGLPSRAVPFSRDNIGMIGAVRALLEQKRIRIPIAGGSPEQPIQGAILLRQLADYSWNPDLQREAPIKANDDYVDALKLAVWGLRRGKPGFARGPSMGSSGGSSSRGP